MAGLPPHEDPAWPMTTSPLTQQRLWEDKVLRRHRDAVSHSSDQVKVINEWVGHYDYNTLTEREFGPAAHRRGRTISWCLNGFSARGLQKGPALGARIAEWIRLWRNTARWTWKSYGLPRIGAKQRDRKSGDFDSAASNDLPMRAHPFARPHTIAQPRK